MGGRGDRPGAVGGEEAEGLSVGCTVGGGSGGPGSGDRCCAAEELEQEHRGPQVGLHTFGRASGQRWESFFK